MTKRFRSARAWLGAALGALATLSGCFAASPLTAAGSTGPQMAQSVPTMRSGGKDRKLGFDFDRYLKEQASKAHPVTLPPVQGPMPVTVDLRPVCSPVLDQGDLGACTAFAVGGGLREYLENKRGEAYKPLSPLFLYYEIRRMRNTIAQDSGATLTDAMKTLQSAGIATEAAWPYDPLRFDVKPASAAYKTAKTYRLSTGSEIKGLEDVKKALVKKQPVVFGMRIFHRFRDLGPDGMLEVPQDGDIYVGGHAVCVVGYDNQKKVLIIRNSWGPAWGDHGYFYMPYAYMTPENVLDIWTAS